VCESAEMTRCAVFIECPLAWRSSQDYSCELEFDDAIPVVSELE
jgi:hypothetical protein